MDTDAYLTFLLVGGLLVLIDAMIIYAGARRYLEQSRGAADSAMPMAGLIVVVFLLVGFAMVALWGSLGLGGWGSTLPGMVGRLGVVLLFLAVAHAVTAAMLTSMADSEAARTRTRRPDAVTNPVPGQPGAHSTVSPSIEQRDKSPINEH